MELRALLRAAKCPFGEEHADWADIELKYAGYLARERDSAERMIQLEEFTLPQGFDYSRVHSISFEAREKLQSIRPGSLGQAGRIPGVSPSDLQNLLAAVLKIRPPETECFT
jgi:tRNA uridine 5-carboxymethylaminomethyl modification enzyme